MELDLHLVGDGGIAGEVVVAAERRQLGAAESVKISTLAQSSTVV